MWNPEIYGRFSEERTQPFRDLLSLVERRPKMRVVDLGCGTGELTRTLHDTLGAEETVGIDSSETMLLETAAFSKQGLHFERADIEAFVPDRPFDLVFSNAALHWVPDHERLFTRLASFLAKDGQLAVQMPANDTHASHVIAAEMAQEFGCTPRPDYILDIAAYSELLHRIGFRRQKVRMQIYGHVLESAAAVVEWVRGALLTDYERQLEAGRWQHFLERYSARLAAALGTGRPYFYTYKRVLLWGSL